MLELVIVLIKVYFSLHMKLELKPKNKDTLK
jgi:hypothetical protein